MTIKEYGDKIAGPIQVSNIHGAYTLYYGMSADLPQELCNLECKGVHGCLSERGDGKLYPAYNGAATRLWVDETTNTYANELTNAIKLLYNAIRAIGDSMPEDISVDEQINRMGPMWYYERNFCQLMSEKGMTIQEYLDYALDQIGKLN